MRMKNIGSLDSGCVNESRHLTKFFMDFLVSSYFSLGPLGFLSGMSCLALRTIFASPARNYTNTEVICLDKVTTKKDKITRVSRRVYGRISLIAESDLDIPIILAA